MVLYWEPNVCYSSRGDGASCACFGTFNVRIPFFLVYVKYYFRLRLIGCVSPRHVSGCSSTLRGFLTFTFYITCVLYSVVIVGIISSLG